MVYRIKSIFLLSLLQTLVFAKGFDGTSLGGGGSALNNPIQAIWQNPAAVFEKVTPLVEGGVVDLSEKKTLFGAFVAPVGRYTTLGGSVEAGPYFDAFDKSYQGVLGLEPFPYAFLGARMRWNITPEVREQVYAFGTRVLLTPELYAGGFVDGVGKNDSLLYQGGLAWYPNLLENPQDLFSFIDVRSPGMQWTGSEVIVGGGVQRGPVQNFRAEMSLRWKQQDGGQAYAHAGIRIQEKFFGVLMQFFYSLGAIGLYQSNQENLIHGVGMGLQIMPFRDIEAPMIAIGSNRSFLDLKSSEAKNQRILFFLRAEDNQKKFKDWHLILANANSELKIGALVRSFSGLGIPPKTVEWEGDDASLQKVRPGLYFYRLLVRDEADNLAQTQWQMLEVK